MSDEDDDGLPKKNGEPITRKVLITSHSIKGFNIKEKKHLDLALKMIQIKYSQKVDVKWSLVPRGKLKPKIKEEDNE